MKLRFRWPCTVLREHGILGMNERNFSLIKAENPRRLFPLVDDKAQTKELAAKAGIAFPELYGLIKSDAEIRNFPKMIEGKQKFVIKPAHGSGGNGIVVIRSVRNGRYFRANGTFLDEQGIEHEVRTAPLRKSKRAEVIAASGQGTVPVIEFADGSGYRTDGKQMAAEIRAGRLFEHRGEVPGA